MGSPRQGNGLLFNQSEPDAGKVLASDKDFGSAIYVETDLTKLPERADDQTSLRSSNGSGEPTRAAEKHRPHPQRIRPRIEEGCTVTGVRRPGNRCHALRVRATTTSPALRGFCKDPLELPVCKRLCTASDPTSFAEIAEELGLSLSERSARRILNEEIKPIISLAELVMGNRK